MGGNIEVESEKGIGSKFLFSIHCQTPTIEALDIFKQTKIKDLKIDKTNNTPPSNKSRALRLLVVEDNLINQKLLTKILEQKGHSCTLSNNGSEAIDQYNTQHFDLIFMVTPIRYS